MVNIGNMMKQAQELQKKMAEAQQKLDSIEVGIFMGIPPANLTCST